MPSDQLYRQLPTEQRNPRSQQLDQLSVAALLSLMHREEQRVHRAITQALPTIAQAVRLIRTALTCHGRLFFVGAGTSGRLAVIEAAECPPTFHTPPSLVQAIVAGGRGAVFRSREGTEDSRPHARQSIRRRVRPGDVVVGIAASGVTSFVDEALKTAARLGAHTILLTCHPHSPIRTDLRIVLPVGPELLTGSTRLKAGTATKLVLNMLTLGAMVQLGKTYGNLMVDVRPTSGKLRARATRIIQTITSCSARQAARALGKSDGHTKIAVLMVSKSLSATAARRLLARHHGHLRSALIL